jgi:RNA polymerase sigma-70 factor, ECF subfamily
MVAQRTALHEALLPRAKEIRIRPHGLILRHFEGLPFAEIAARMERRENRVQKLWVRALVQLSFVPLCCSSSAHRPHSASTSARGIP